MRREKLIILVLASALGWLAIFYLCLPDQESVMAHDLTTIVVNTLQDEDNSDGDCSLREAIKAASNNAAVDACPAGGTLTDTITFSVEGTIVLASQLLITPGDLLVISAEDAITIDGDAEVRMFIVYEGADLRLEDISLVNGTSGDLGGAIYNLGELSILSSNLYGNRASDGNGGAIYNAGNLRIEYSDFSDNEAIWEGGAIYNAEGAMLNVSAARFTDNRSYSGAGIQNFGVLNISSSTLTAGRARRGGGIVNSSILTVTNSTFSENVAFLISWQDDFGGFGGGVFNEDTLSIDNSTFFANQAERNGGGIYIYYGGTVDLSNTTIRANHAIEKGGGICIMSSWGFSEIHNSTLSANSSDTNGGGIWSNQDLLGIMNSTIYSNTAANTGGNLYISSSSHVHISNSIIAGSSSACDCDSSIEPCNEKFNDQGHNIEDTNTCFFSAANGSLPDTDPQLMPLDDNGGPTLTHALMPTSPAIDEIDPAGCISTDQRGVARPIDGDVDGNALCDIGSYEYQLATTTTITGDDPDPTLEGEPFTVAFEVESSYGIPTGEVMVTVSGSEEDCTGTLSDGNGSCVLTLHEAGVYTLTATYLGAGELGRSSDETQHIVESSTVGFYLPVIFK